MAEAHATSYERELTLALNAVERAAESASNGSDVVIQSVGRLSAEVVSRARAILSTADIPDAVIPQYSQKLRSLELGLMEALAGGERSSRVATDCLHVVTWLRVQVDLLDAVAADEAHEADSNRSSGEPVLLAEAQAYAKDALDEARAANTLLMIGVLLGAASVGLALYGLSQASDASGIDRTQLFYYAVVACIPFLGGVGVLIESYRRRRHSDEARRLHRQLATFEVYTRSFPRLLRHPVHAAMMQRFFPRLLGDSDPFRESEWPGPDMILRGMAEQTKQDRLASRQASVDA